MIQLNIETEFQKSVALQLKSEGIGEISNDTLQLTDNEVYQLDSEQLAYFSRLNWFEGDMELEYVYPDSFKFNFYETSNSRVKLRNSKVEGCKFYRDINIDQFYILPESMFQLVELTNRLNSISESEKKRSNLWNVIEIAKNNSDERIKFTGLPESEVVTRTSPIEIDLKINDDQTATVIPHIVGLSDDKNEKFKYKLLDSQGMQVLSEIKDNNGDRYRVRYITDEETVKAYQRVNAVGTIAKENVYKFIKNPASFILKDDESIDDLPISFDSYRILGMGMPYEGYFGSSILDESPLTTALFSERNDDIISDFKQKIVEICDEKTIEEISNIKNQLITAQECQKESCIVGADEEGNGGIRFIPVTYPIGIDVIEKILEDKTEPLSEEDNKTKLVLSIAANDEISVSFDNNNNKSLEEISTNNLKRHKVFDYIKFPPKSYQIAGVNWLIDLYENNFNGALLADDMGLGKTYQVIAFLAHLYQDSSAFKGKDRKRVLIVAPTILLDNWNEEINKFLVSELANKIQVHVVRGSDLRNRREEHTVNEGTFNSFDVKRFLERETDVVITTYETISNYQFSFADKLFNWGCIIYDEAHKIKNPNSQISQASRAISSGADFNILLTGTPIENELRDLWALFDVFDPSHFGSWKTFRQNFVQNSKDVDSRLRQKASNYILRRLKKDHLEELPEKITKEHIVCLSEDEARTYDTYRQSIDSALERLHKLKAFSLYGNLLIDSLNANTENEPIDLEEFSKTKALLTVLHSIKDRNEKVIIFCINKLTQNILQYGINKHFDIDTKIINGSNNSPARVERILNEFDTSKGFDVLILSTIAAGVGLTITSANHVIHYERWWNASKEDQASDRAYRIGQQKNVYIHYLITQHPNEEITTIDQAVHDLISHKRETAGFLIPPKGISTGEVVDSTMSATLPEKILALSPKEFEILVLRIYEHLGYSCNLTPDGIREYGADVIAKKDSSIVAIQCKHSSKNRPQDNTAVVQLTYEAKEHYRATELVAVTNSVFNNIAREMAKKQKVNLVESEELFNLIEQFDLA